jgi:hypothetical protein
LADVREVDGGVDHVIHPQARGLDDRFQVIEGLPDLGREGCRECTIYAARPLTGLLGIPRAGPLGDLWHGVSGFSFGKDLPQEHSAHLPAISRRDTCPRKVNCAAEVRRVLPGFPLFSVRPGPAWEYRDP